MSKKLKQKKYLVKKLVQATSLSQALKLEKDSEPLSIVLIEEAVEEKELTEAIGFQVEKKKQDEYEPDV